LGEVRGCSEGKKADLTGGGRGEMGGVRGRCHAGKRMDGSHMTSWNFAPRSSARKENPGDQQYSQASLREDRKGRKNLGVPTAKPGLRNKIRGLGGNRGEGEVDR